jgi:opacity protein-like surface antigen
MRRDAQAYVSLSYFDNLMREQTRTDLAAVGASLTSITGTTWQLSGRDRGIAATGGAKYVAPLGVFRPYAGGGGGLINIRRTITDARAGDVKQAVFNDFLVGDAELVGIESSTKPIGEIVAGVGLIFKHTYVDASYRYRKVFRVGDLDFSQFGVGVGYKF